MSTVSEVFKQKKLWEWWTQNGGRGTNAFNGVTEKGIDYAGTFGTPIGVPVGGHVLRVVHNNNSIGDVVELQASDGSVWLYQHITAKVKVGQALGVGDVVGSENGLPIDQFSTGPHIEVRYAAPGSWKATTDSWFEPWISPYGIFSTIGNTTAGTIGTVPGGGGGGIFTGGNGTGPVGLFPIGLKPIGIAPNADVTAFLLALDTAGTLINPFIVQGVQEDTLGIAPIAVTFPDPISWIEGFGINLVEDLVAILFRLLLIIIGVVLVFRVVNSFVDIGKVQQDAQDNIMKLAPMIAALA